VALELEHAVESAISFNIGTLYLYGHASAALTDMMGERLRMPGVGLRGRVVCVQQGIPH
jgi:hypothetical protein